MRLLLATGDENLNGYIKEAFSSAKIRECLYREAVPGELARWKPDVAVISVYLPGSADLVALARQVRYRGARVVFILDSSAKIERKDLVSGLISCGVYDLVFAPAPYEAVAERIKKPADFRYAVDAAGLRQALLPEPDMWPEDRHVGPLDDEGAAEHFDKADDEKPGLAAPEIASCSQARACSEGEEAAAGGRATEVPDSSRREAENAAEEADAEVYVLGAAADLPGTAAFSDKEGLFSALAARKPKAVVVSAGFPGALDLVRELRSVSRLCDVAIGVLGEADGRFFAAGADECFERLDGEALARLYARRERLLALWQEASTDALTGLCLRRYLDAHLEHAFEMHREHGVPFSVVLFDLDHFKRINDSYGHSAGDEVLRRFGDFLRKNLRERDAAFRYGGEEIVLVLPGADIEEAVRIAERLRRGWEALDVYGSTFSAGAAQAGLHGEDAESLLAAADRALYAAKRSGRNRVLTADAAAADEGTAGSTAGGVSGRYERKPGSPGLSERGRAKLVAVASPFVHGVGVSTVAALLAKALSGRRRVAAVDCDVHGRGLGVRLGLEPHVAAAYDWRKAELPVYAGDVAVYPLDPAANGVFGDCLLPVRAATWQSDVVVADLGADPDRKVLAEADVAVWVVRPDAVALERAAARWRDRPRTGCREVAVLFGSGDLRQVEELLLVPCYVLRGPQDRKGLAPLARFVLSPEARRGVRVLAVGYQHLPDVEGVVWDPAPNAKAAQAWVACHRPEIAVVRPGLPGEDLVEYDLRKIGVPVYRLPDLRKIKEALQA